MSKVFETQFETGSYIEKFSGAVATPYDMPIRKTERGFALHGGQDNALRLVYPSVTSLPTPYSFSFWIKLKPITQWQASYVGLLGNLLDAAYQVILRDNGRLYLYKASENEVDFSFPLTYAWQHIVVTDDGTNLKFYADNVEVHSGTWIAGGIDAAFLFDMLGNRATSVYEFVGDMLKFQAFSHVLTDAERTADYAALRRGLYVLGKDKYPIHNPHSKPTDLSGETGIVRAYRRRLQVIQNA